MAYYPNNIPELARLAEESSLTTHASEQCMSACRYMALVLSALIHGEDRSKVLSPTWGPLAELNDIKPLHPLVLAVARGSFREKQPPTIRGSGWVVQSLEAALWAFHEASSFEEAVLKAVNLGDDADTTGAVCGQFAGAFWGESGIPSSLREGLARQDMLNEALEGLMAGASTPRIAPDELPKRQNVSSEPLFVVVVAEDQFRVAHCQANELQQSWIRLSAVNDPVAIDDSGPPLAIWQIAQLCLGDLEVSGNEVRDGFLPEIGVADVSPVVREDNSGLVAEFQDVNGETFHD